MNKITEQQKNFATLWNLITAHPTYRVVPMVDHHVVASDEYDWWVATWGAPRLEEVCMVEGETFIRSLSEHELIDEAAADYQFHTRCTDAEAKTWAKKAIQAYPWERIIAVSITI